MPSNTVLGKVTAFVTRETDLGRELLVFRHPNAGVQLPAGTIEPEESPEAAVLREVWEETGLTRVEIVRSLDIMMQPLAPDERVLLQSAHLLSASDTSALHMDTVLHRGWRVRLKRIEGEFAEVAYEAFEMHVQLVVTSSVEGWLPANLLTQRVERHLFHLHLTASAPDGWQHPADMGHTFQLYWAALDEINDLVPVQQDWLHRVRGRLQNQ
jgi:8-oxo-dGTP pyrophosphatase MutT (NUDIX family)